VDKISPEQLAAPPTDTISAWSESVPGARPVPFKPEGPDVAGEHRSDVARIDYRDTASVLHIGCGVYAREKLPPIFRPARWREIRLDIDPNVQPDIVASITDMKVVSDGTVDAVYSAHNIEHLYPHEVPLALGEIHRVLKLTGFAFIRLPDLQEVARHIAEGKLENALYMSPMGPIAPLDILFGHRASLAGGNLFMAHRTGFIDSTLGAALIKAGFAAVMVQRSPSAFNLDAIAFWTMPTDEQVRHAQAEMLPSPDRAAVLYSL
jgi:Methyltransferase domain